MSQNIIRSMTPPKKSKRGFASMTPEKRRAIASRGGTSAQKRGKAHRFDREEARVAGRRGGSSIAKNREHMRQIGRKGGKGNAGLKRKSL